MSWLGLMKVSTHKAVVAEKERLSDSLVLVARNFELERDAAYAERDHFAHANHRQAYCIQQCAAILGPNFSATVDGLPKGVRHVVDRLAAPETPHTRPRSGAGQGTPSSA